MNLAILYYFMAVSAQVSPSPIQVVITGGLDAPTFAGGIDAPTVTGGVD